MQNNGKGLSVAGLVLGICSVVVGLLINGWVGLICGIIGIVLSVMGRNKAKAAGAPTGMGTAGLVGQITTYQTMAAERGSVTTLLLILLLHFILPAILTLFFSEFMRKKGWIKDGDMKLNM